jgi:WD40 repeat protein
LALEAIPKMPFDRPATPEAEQAVELVIWRFPLHRFRHRKYVSSAKFDPSGRRIVTASASSSDRTAVIWDANTGGMIATLKGHEGGVGRTEFSPDGARVVTASYDGTARIWNTATGAELVRLPVPGQEPKGWEPRRVMWARFSPDGSRILTLSEGQTVRIWDAITGRCLLRFPVDKAWDAAFDPQGKAVLVASGEDETVILFEAISGRVIRRYPCEREPDRVAFSPDGTRIAAGTFNGPINVWNTGDPQDRFLLLSPGDYSSIVHLGFSPDGKYLATSGNDYTTRLWDMRERKQIAFLQRGSYVSTIVFSSDGVRVVTASQDKMARILQVPSGAEIARLDLHTDIVQNAEFSPDGTQVVTASDDGTAILWNFVPTNDLVHQLCSRTVPGDRTLSMEARRRLKLSGIVRDPCDATYYGLNQLWAGFRSK